MKIPYIAALFAVFLLVGGGCSLGSKTDDTAMHDDDTRMTDDNMMGDDMESGVMVGGAMMVPSKNIVENAMNASNLTTLVAAVAQADLVDTLSGPGPFTVFAPTNDGFDKLPEGALEGLMMDSNKGVLVNVLTYHVVPGAYRTSDFTNGMQLTTVQGEKLTLTEKNGKWYVNGEVMIETPDIISSNGISHVISEPVKPSDESMQAAMKK